MAEREQDTTKGAEHLWGVELTAAIREILSRNSFPHKWDISVGSHAFMKDGVEHVAGSGFSAPEVAKALLDEEYWQDVADLLAERDIESMSKAATNNSVVASDENDTSQLPAKASFILRLLLDQKDIEAVIGDLCEQYEREVGKRGRRRANLWLYYEAARSVWPLLSRLFTRIRGRITRISRVE